MNDILGVRAEGRKKRGPKMESYRTASFEGMKPEYEGNTCCHKKQPASAGDAGLILKLGRSPGAGNSYPLQYSCLENSTDRGVWRATVHGVAKSQT